MIYTLACQVDGWNKPECVADGVVTRAVSDRLAAREFRFGGGYVSLRPLMCLSNE